MLSIAAFLVLVCVAVYWAYHSNLFEGTKNTEATSCWGDKRLIRVDGECVCDNSNGYYAVDTSEQKRIHEDIGRHTTGCVKCPADKISEREENGKIIKFCDTSGAYGLAEREQGASFALSGNSGNFDAIFKKDVYNSSEWEGVQIDMEESNLTTNNIDGISVYGCWQMDDEGDYTHYPLYNAQWKNANEKYSCHPCPQGTVGGVDSRDQNAIWQTCIINDEELACDSIGKSGVPSIKFEDEDAIYSKLTIECDGSDLFSRDYIESQRLMQESGLDTAFVDGDEVYGCWDKNDSGDYVGYPFTEDGINFSCKPCPLGTFGVTQKKGREVIQTCGSMAGYSTCRANGVIAQAKLQRVDPASVYSEILLDCTGISFDGVSANEKAIALKLLREYALDTDPRRRIMSIDEMFLTTKENASNYDMLITFRDAPTRDAEPPSWDLEASAISVEINPYNTIQESSTIIGIPSIFETNVGCVDKGGTMTCDRELLNKNFITGERYKEIPEPRETNQWERDYNTSVQWDEEYYEIDQEEINKLVSLIEQNNDKLKGKPLSSTLAIKQYQGNWYEIRLERPVIDDDNMNCTGSIYDFVRLQISFPGLYYDGASGPVGYHVAWKLDEFSTYDGNESEAQYLYKPPKTLAAAEELWCQTAVNLLGIQRDSCPEYLRLHREGVPFCEKMDDRPTCSCLVERIPTCEMFKDIDPKCGGTRPIDDDDNGDDFNDDNNEDDGNGDDFNDEDDGNGDDFNDGDGEESQDMIDFRNKVNTFLSPYGGGNFPYKHTGNHTSPGDALLFACRKWEEFEDNEVRGDFLSRCRELAKNDPLCNTDTPPAHCACVDYDHVDCKGSHSAFPSGWMPVLGSGDFEEPVADPSLQSKAYYLIKDEKEYSANGLPEGWGTRQAELLLKKIDWITYVNGKWIKNYNVRVVNLIKLNGIHTIQGKSANVYEIEVVRDVADTGELEYSSNGTSINHFSRYAVTKTIVDGSRNKYNNKEWKMLDNGPNGTDIDFSTMGSQIIRDPGSYNPEILPEILHTDFYGNKHELQRTVDSDARVKTRQLRMNTFLYGKRGVSASAFRPLFID